MRIHKMTFARALALCLPLFLAGCGGEDAPVDPCKKLEKKIKGKTVSDAKENARAFIEKRKKAIAKKYEKTIKFGTPTLTCTMPEIKETKPKEVKKEVKSDDPWAVKKKTKKPKPPQATCEVVLTYCVK
jgi:hypothetical protein